MPEAKRDNEVYRLIGRQRLAALSSSPDRLDSGMLAFRWEMDVRSAILPPLGIAEIALRNAIDCALTEWWREEGNSGFWTEESAGDCASVLHPFVHSKEWGKRAAKNLSQQNRPVTHADLIAHTSFGTWKNMIGNPIAIPRQMPCTKDQIDSLMALKRRDAQCAALWKAALSNAFPHIPSKKARGGLSPRAYIGTRVSRISSLRNRVCHWDSLAKVNLSMRYADICELVGAIDPSMRQWADELYRGRIDAVFNQKPTWL